MNSDQTVLEEYNLHHLEIKFCDTWHLEIFGQKPFRGGVLKSALCRIFRGETVFWSQNI